MTQFTKVSEMNEKFGNPKGNPKNIDWSKVMNQSKNILDEYNELMLAIENKDLDEVRDALCDVMVFTLGVSHIMGIDADKDMESVLNALYTRFMKDTDDVINTLYHHQSKGITQVKVEGTFPYKILRSVADQPDAPKGKFLKSVSSVKPKFYKID